MTCPHCRKRIAARLILSAAGKIRGARSAGKTGRKPVLRECPKCGELHSARAMRTCKAPVAQK